MKQAKQINLDNYFVLSELEPYKIDCIFHPMDQIVPDEFAECFGKQESQI